MIITKKFVLLNLPKTGSTFVRSVLKKIYKNRNKGNLFFKIAKKIKILKPPYKELILPNIKFKQGVVNHSDQHGVYSQIPEKDKNKTIVSVVRNPFDRLISTYEFQFWKGRPALEKNILELNFPNFPNLSIDEYIDYLILVGENSYENKPKNINIGLFSLQFIYFFFKEPKSVIKKINKEYLENETLFKEDLAEITFLKQESLSKDLIDFLIHQGFSKKELEFIHTQDKINVTENKTVNRSDLITPKVIDYIENYEQFYIKVLKSKGINYTNPF
ncbi:sulfotransferase domain-containing protein [Winogradskyella helgolandensis]|uniref:sulfotransferase domain-containing protein n=1 Tax=Winogradskyella helgolandensis TaxID=2697010 RepID=UPI0015C7BB9F|nr:sulfotransferase domain-containing protein [Winogradskyella helgolandensis]